MFFYQLLEGCEKKMALYKYKYILSLDIKLFQTALPPLYLQWRSGLQDDMAADTGLSSAVGNQLRIESKLGKNVFEKNLKKI